MAKKPPQKAYSLMQLSDEWSEMLSVEISEEDILSYARDGLIDLQTVVTRQKFEVLNRDNLKDGLDCIAADGTTWLFNVYFPIESRWASVLLHDEPIPTVSLKYNDMQLRPENGVIHFYKQDVYVLHEDRIKFENSVLNIGSATTEKPLTTTERNSLLTIIAALCDYSDIKHQERGAASQIVRMIEEMGASVSHETVKRALDKIPDALESRMK